MQITINVPDDLPPAIVQQQISEFEEKLKQQSKATNQSVSKWQKMVQKIQTNAFDLSDYTETFNQDRQEFKQSFYFKDC